VIKIPYIQEHSCRIKSPKLFQEGKYARLSKKSDGKPFILLIGRLKGQTTTITQAIRYPIKSWSEAQAKKHCKAHNGILFEPAVKKKGENK